jgi:Fe-S cluster assembly ATP-binding protein
MTQSTVFTARDVRVYLDETEIVKGVDLSLKPGEVHALMGPNGSGKSTFAQAVAGHPHYRLEGEIVLDGEAMSDMEPDERARRGLFLGFQYPVAIPGVTVANFIRAAVEARTGESVSLMQFRKELLAELKLLSIPEAFAGRYINDGFSGGEKKRLEILQLLMLKPKFALLDEIDSGLDIDALKVVSKGINRATEGGTAVLLVTHYQRILNYVKPDVVHVFVDGRIARTGGPEQALELEKRGYEQWLGGGAQAAVGGV